MRVLLITLCVLLAAAPTFGQAGAGQGKDAEVREELRKLSLAYYEAESKKDRAALERLFADEYVWYQANGNVVSKAKHINNILGNEAPSSMPTPSFDRLVVFGEAAVNRGAFEGGVTTTIFAKRGGRWLFAQAVSARVLPERKPADVDPKTFDLLVGKYELAPGRSATVTREGNSLMWQGGRRPKVRLLPLSETRFFAEGTDLEMIFRRGEKGQVTAVSLRQGICQESELKRVE